MRAGVSPAGRGSRNTVGRGRCTLPAEPGHRRRGLTRLSVPGLPWPHPCRPLHATMELHMSFQWLQMRIQEERERRELQAKHLARLPAALQEIHDLLAECIESYNANFGADSADIALLPDRIKVTVQEERDGKWQLLSK